MLIEWDKNEKQSIISVPLYNCTIFIVDLRIFHSAELKLDILNFRMSSFNADFNSLESKELKSALQSRCPHQWC